MTGDAGNDVNDVHIEEQLDITGEDSAEEDISEEEIIETCPPSDYLTVEEVISNPDDYNDSLIWVRGFFGSHRMIRCTEIACGDPFCCNACSSSATLQQVPFNHNQEIALLSALDHLYLGCEGNECFVTCTELTRGVEYYARGLFRAETLTLEVDMYCALTGEIPSPAGTYIMQFNSLLSNTCLDEPGVTEPPRVCDSITIYQDPENHIWYLEQNIWSLGILGYEVKYELSFDDDTYTSFTGNAQRVCGVECPCLESIGGELRDPGALTISLHTHIALDDGFPCVLSCSLDWQLWGEKTSN